MRKIIYISLGFLFVALGAVGALLPVLPTTPFLLLALFFFSKGSYRFERWFKSTKLYKNHLEEFVKNRSMRRSVKIRLLLTASAVLILSAYLVKIAAFRIFMGFVIVFKYYYFLCKIKTTDSVAKEGSSVVESENT